MGQLYHSILSNKKGSIDFESDYYSSNDSSFNTTILNENSLSLSFILKDNKEEKNLISEPQLYDEFLIKDAKNDKSSLNPNIKGQNYQVEDTNNNMNKSKIYPSQPSGRNNFSLSKEFNDPDLGDSLEFYKKRAESLFIKHSSHPFIKTFNNLSLEQKYDICVMAWKNHQKSLAIEILESIIYDSRNMYLSKNSRQKVKDDRIIRQANKFLGFCYLTGIIYFTGYIEKEDAAADSLHLAEKWFKMAAERGHLSSQIMLLYLMYMEEERSLRHHYYGFQERNTLINETEIQELSFMFNEKTLEKIKDRVKRINQNIKLHTHPMTIMTTMSSTMSTMPTTLGASSSSLSSSYFLPNENTSSSTTINSTQTNYALTAINSHNSYSSGNPLSSTTNKIGGNPSSSTTNRTNWRSYDTRSFSFKLNNTFSSSHTTLNYSNQRDLKKAAFWYHRLIDHEEYYLKLYPWMNNNILYTKYQLARLAPTANESLDWLNMAAKDGNAMAQTCLGQYYFEQQVLQSKMQNYLLEHSQEFDLPNLFGKKKFKSFESIVHLDHFQNTDGFLALLKELFQKISIQDLQEERDFYRKLIPDMDYFQYNGINMNMNMNCHPSSYPSTSLHQTKDFLSLNYSTSSTFLTPTSSFSPSAPTQENLLRHSEYPTTSSNKDLEFQYQSPSQSPSQSQSHSIHSTLTKK
ncbi:hypothetical protein H8356DRAFT_902608, partial [Neocallimastix lanati (nom. inval.)]